MFVKISSTQRQHNETRCHSTCDHTITMTIFCDRFRLDPSTRSSSHFKTSIIQTLFFGSKTRPKLRDPLGSSRSPCDSDLPFIQLNAPPIFCHRVKFGRNSFRGFKDSIASFCLNRSFSTFFRVWKPVRIDLFSRFHNMKNVAIWRHDTPWSPRTICFDVSSVSIKNEIDVLPCDTYEKTIQNCHAIVSKNEHSTIQMTAGDTSTVNASLTKVLSTTRQGIDAFMRDRDEQVSKRTKKRNGLQSISTPKLNLATLN